MATAVQKFVRNYGAILGLVFVSGVAATFISHAELKDAPQLTADNWPQAQLHTATIAAMVYRADKGHLPASLAELRAANYLPDSFDFGGVLYFREGDGHKQPRLSWRDDAHGATAYCSLDAALREKC